jgi:hypothetical protein
VVAIRIIRRKKVPALSFFSSVPLFPVLSVREQPNAALGIRTPAHVLQGGLSPEEVSALYATDLST